MTPSSGRQREMKVAPRPSLAVTHKRPPCDSTIERLMANPIPLPCADLPLSKALNSAQGRASFDPRQPLEHRLRELWIVLLLRIAMKGVLLGGVRIQSVIAVRPLYKFR
jgi:hypothetical protein